MKGDGSVNQPGTEEWGHEGMETLGEQREDAEGGGNEGRTEKLAPLKAERALRRQELAVEYLRADVDLGPRDQNLDVWSQARMALPQSDGALQTAPPQPNPLCRGILPLAVPPPSGRLTVEHQAAFHGIPRAAHRPHPMG
jgi:hypothetical protein